MTLCPFQMSPKYTVNQTDPGQGMLHLNLRWTGCVFRVYIKPITEIFNLQATINLKAFHFNPFITKQYILIKGVRFNHHFFCQNLNSLFCRLWWLPLGSALPLINNEDYFLNLLDCNISQEPSSKWTYEKATILRGLRRTREMSSFDPERTCGKVSIPVDRKVFEASEVSHETRSRKENQWSKKKKSFTISNLRNILYQHT